MGMACRDTDPPVAPNALISAGSASARFGYENRIGFESGVL